MVKNLKELLEKAKAAENVPAPIVSTSYGSSKPSFGIVCSKDNGKRLSFSKALTKKLGLENEVSLLPVLEDGVLLISNGFDTDNASVGKLSGDEKKCCYSAPLVQMIIESFGLDWGKRTSKSFDDISFEYVDDKMVAAVKIQ